MSPIAPTVLDAWMYPNEVAADLAQWAPQALLMDVLDQLTPATLSVDGRIDALLAVQRHLGLLHAQETELLAALDIGDDTSDEFTRDCVAAALRVPPASMRTRMTIARELADRLPATVALLRAGEITQRHALALADATHSLSAESAAAVETRVLIRAPEQTSTQFRASVRRAVLRESTPAAEEKSHQDAVSERRVVMIPADRGMAFVNCFLTADGAATVMSALDAIAYETIHGKGGDSRPADQRRADALVELCVAALADPHLARGHGQRPGIQVTIAASTLMGLDDQPAELDGYGLITAAMARRIASDPTATWRRLLTDDDGLVRSAGAKTYRPPPDMVRTIVARDEHCVFPGCRRKSQYTDLDHVDAYREGDETTEANLMSLCRRHHRLKHGGRWKVHRNDTTGVTTWTDRRGRSYRTHPPTKPTTTSARFEIRPDVAEARSLNGPAAPSAMSDDDPPPF